jgi:hypothetical protein
MHSSRVKVRNGRSGQAGLFIALNLTLVFGLVGLAVDVGWAYYTKQAAQAAADASALAAVSYASSVGAPACGSTITCNTTAAGCSNPPTSPPVTDLDVACLYAQKNGYVNDGTTQWVSMLANTTAPPGVSNNSPAYWVQSNIKVMPFTLFGRFGGISQFTINASAIAGVSYYSANACIYAVGSGNISKAFDAEGNATVTATCGIFVNSTSGDAYYTTGRGTTVTATQILVNGGANINNSSVSPTPTTGAGAVSDPLIAFAEPTFSTPTCAYNNTSVSSGTLSPGTYCGGIAITGGPVTFSPGNYIINGGLTISGGGIKTFGAGVYILNGNSGGYSMNISGGGDVTGTGVTFFNTGQYGQTIGPVSITGSGTITLSAPTSGAYQGMLFLQDRNLSYTGSNVFSGSSSSVFQGTLYFPKSGVSYSGVSTAGSYTAIISSTATFSGTTVFRNDPTGSYTGLATAVRGLIQ